METNFKLVEFREGLDRGILADPRAKASVRDLSGHPGFQYLLAKLRLYRGYLRTQLEGGSHERMRDVDKLQIGIEMTKWLETELKASVPLAPPRTTEPDQEEIELLNRISSDYVDVGRAEKGHKPDTV